MLMHKHNKKSGQAALISVFFVMMIMLSAVFGVSSLAINEHAVATEDLKSRNSFFAAEAGVDDAVYRFKRGKNIGSSFAITLNDATADIEVSTISSSHRKITAIGDASDRTRAVSADVSESTNDVQFFYGVQVGDAGLSMNNNSAVNGSVYSNGNITGSGVITGDVVVAGGINDNPIDQWIDGVTDQPFATASTNRDIAQSFIASAAGTIGRVSVYLGKIGDPPSDITIRIAADNGGKPSTVSMASASIENSSVGSTPSWIDIAFVSPPSLVQGAKYWIILDYGSNSATKYWNWIKDSTGGYVNNTGKYTGNWSSGSAVWTDINGDLLFRVWIGGVNHSIGEITVGTASSGTGRANLFLDTTIHGSECPNPYCIVDNPPRQEMPISDGVLQDWRDAASAGGTCAQPICTGSGDYMLSNGAVGTLGPIKINGDLTMSNNADLTITGTIWVTGNVTISNNCIVRLDSAYGDRSGVIIVDGTVTVSNNCVFYGSGNPNSYVLLLTDKNMPDAVVMTVSNNSNGVIYYASKGKISLSNNARAKEVTGYGISMSNGATITYESGLADLHFSSGPAGGWSIDSWREVEP